jgi:uncharacterized membrane protein
VQKKKIGFRPILRYFTNRYYLVYAVVIMTRDINKTNTFLIIKFLFSELLRTIPAYNEEQFIEVTLNSLVIKRYNKILLLIATLPIIQRKLLF